MQIKKYKKLKDNRYEIELDDIKIILYDDVIIKYNLLLIKELDNKLLEEITSYNEKLSAYYKSIKYINIRQRSTKEIENYLHKNNYSAVLIKETISKLKSDHFINNDLYIGSYINDQINFKLDGPLKIKRNLSNLGFNDEEIDNHLNKVKTTIWQEKVSKIIDKRLKLNHKDTLKIFKEKTNIYLLNLGYSYELINDRLFDVQVNEEQLIEKDLLKLKTKLSKKYHGNELNYYLKNKLYAKGYNLDIINKYLN